MSGIEAKGGTLVYTKGKWSADFVKPEGDTLTVSMEFSPGPIGREIAGNVRLMESAPHLFEALKVISLDPKISTWLAANDPKALKQVCGAIAMAEGDQ